MGIDRPTKFVGFPEDNVRERSTTNHRRSRPETVELARGWNGRGLEEIQAARKEMRLAWSKDDEVDVREARIKAGGEPYAPIQNDFTGFAALKDTGYAFLAANELATAERELEKAVKAKNESEIKKWSSHKDRYQKMLELTPPMARPTQLELELDRERRQFPKTNANLSPELAQKRLQLVAQADALKAGRILATAEFIGEESLGKHDRAPNLRGAREEQRTFQKGDIVQSRLDGYPPNTAWKVLFVSHDAGQPSSNSKGDLILQRVDTGEIRLWDPNESSIRKTAPAETMAGKTPYRGETSRAATTRKSQTPKDAFSSAGSQAASPHTETPPHSTRTRNGTEAPLRPSVSGYLWRNLKKFWNFLNATR